MKKQCFRRKAVAFALAFLLASVIPFGVKAANITALSENRAPVVGNIEVKTYKEIAVSAPLRAVDPDGDLVRFSVVKAPRKGTVNITGTGFTYTPDPGFKGEDSFTYSAFDSAGAVSREAKVSVTVNACKSGVSYADMDGNDGAFAAQRLAETGIFTGRKVGESYFFDPDETVTRGEFLAMCMDASGMERLDGVKRTGFFDDEAISVWAKPYVSSALLAGVVRGYRESDGSVVFRPDSAVTCAEAAVMLSNALQISDVSGGDLPENAVESWAYQAVSNLEQCSVISCSADYDGSRALTRVEAAKMLSSAMDVLEKRDNAKHTSFLERIFG